MVLFSLTAGPNGTQFRSLRPLGLNRIRFCPGRPVLNGTRFCSRTAESQRNPVLFTPDSCFTTELGSVHPGGCFSTELSSAHGRPILNGTQFRSRAAASQRSPVLFTPDSCITTGLGSVPLDGRFSTELSSASGRLHHNGTRFCSPRMAASQRKPVLFTRAADSQRNSVPLTSGCIPTEPGSVHPGQLHHNGTRFCSPGRPILNGTRFCSPRRLVLNGTQFCSPGQQLPTELDSGPGWQLPAEPGSVLSWQLPTELGSVLPASNSQRNSVPLPGWQLPTEPGSGSGVAAPNGTRFRSRMAAPSGTRFCSRGGGSQRNSVPFPGWQFPTELSSVPG